MGLALLTRLLTEGVRLIWGPLNARLTVGWITSRC